MFLACQSYQELLIHPFHCWNVQFVWPLKKEMHSFPPLPVFPSFSSSWNRELSPRVTTACRSVSSPRRAVWSPSTAAAPWPCSCWPWVTSTSSGAHSASAASWGSTSPCDPPLPSPSPNEQYGGGEQAPVKPSPTPAELGLKWPPCFYGLGMTLGGLIGEHKPHVMPVLYSVLRLTSISSVRS